MERWKGDRTDVARRSAHALGSDEPGAWLEAPVRLVAQKALHLIYLHGLIARRRGRVENKHVASLVPLSKLLQAAAVNRDLVGFCAVDTRGGRHDDPVVGNAFFVDDSNFLTHFDHWESPPFIIG